MFDTLTIRDARPIAVMKKTFQIGVAAYLVIGLIAGYRAWYQVHSLDLNSGEQTLHNGSAINTKVVSYARTPVTVKLELIQGTHSEVLSTRGLRGNEWGFFDPRPKQATQSFILPSETLAHFQKGPAILRATATGCKQLQRLPPPVVRELTVAIGP